MVGDAGEAGPVEAVLAGLADALCSALVFVVGGYVAEGGVQAAGELLCQARGRIRVLEVVLEVCPDPV